MEFHGPDCGRLNVKKNVWIRQYVPDRSGRPGETVQEAAPQP